MIGFERAFTEFGLPTAIRTDHGIPFSSAKALFGLSTLSVWWLRLGIRIERIGPGHPEQNGRHERMHLTLNLGGHFKSGHLWMFENRPFPGRPEPWSATPGDPRPRFGSEVNQ